MPAGAQSFTASMPQTATSSPAAPPNSVSNRLSVSICATSRPRLAPSAALSASSRRRPAAATSSRFATFTLATSSTRPVAPSTSQRARRTSCTT